MNFCANKILINAGVIFSVLCSLFFPASTSAQEMVVDIFKAEVTQILSSERQQLEGFDIEVLEQEVEIRGLDGVIENKTYTFTQNKLDLEVGDVVFVQVGEQSTITLIERQRIPMLLYLVGLFVLAIIALNGRQGLKALGSLAISLVVLLFVLIPLVLQGFNVLLVSIVIGSAILALVLYISHGFNKRSTVALVGTSGALMCAGLLSFISTRWMKLTGLGSDESVSALMSTGGNVDFAGLLLAGIIIGMLGVLDDISITQVSVVAEIKKANPKLSFMEIFRRALRVGKEHINALVNTLVLAYTGASFSMLILLYNSGTRLDLLLSQEIVAAEIVRILVGSIGLIIAVPLTTYLATRYVTGEDVGDGHSGDSHSHNHSHH